MEQIKNIKYSVYKESGEDWLGSVPHHWEIKSLKAILAERKENNNPIKTSNILSLSMDKGVTLYSEKGAGGNKAKDDLSAYKIAHPNDIVVNSMNVIVGSVGLSKYYGAVSPVYYTLYARNSETDINFYDNIFQNPRFQMSLFGLGNGILIKKSETSNKLNTIRLRIPMDKLNKVIMPYPPKREQTAIAGFLDRKTSLIEKAIGIKEKQIELLKERRQILIHKAVTRGLNPNVKLKHSGVKWIGDIPTHWGVADLRRFTLEHRQGYYTENGYNDSGHRVVRITDLIDNNIIDISNSPYYLINEESRNRYELKIGDFLFQRTGSHKKIGVFYSDEPSIYASYLIRFRFNEKINHLFLLCFLNSQAYSSQLNEQIHGGVNPNIHAENIKICKVIYPPIIEQIQIAEHIGIASQKIFTAISLKEQEIEKLKEYKATLINSAVTGKIKVS